MKTSGVYGIWNRVSEKWYVGQSIDLTRRIPQHFQLFSYRTHRNSHLQAAYDKYGASVFEVYLLQLVPSEQLDAVEKYWISRYQSNDPRYGYNLDDGGSTGNRRVESVRAKIAAARRGPASERLLAHLARIHEARRGTTWSEASRAKLSRTTKNRRMTDQHAAQVKQMSDKSRGVKTGKWPESRRIAWYKTRWGDYKPKEKTNNDGGKTDKAIT